MLDDDTIVAVSTPPGEGGIGIVRLSGNDAVRIADGIFVPASGASLSETPSHRIRYGHVRVPATGEVVDEVLVSVMRSPKTYTREDIVEINCHGGYVPVSRVLELALKSGARLAGPGEFTKRAFLNGRIDLSQAEAVIDLIQSKTALSEKAAIEHLRGRLSEKINALRDVLIGISAEIEAHIDFPEEDISPAALGEIGSKAETALKELSALSGTFREGRILREGLKAAIVGKPNVGKSSLLNALAERERAIVTEHPGTTRDIIEEYIGINGLPVRIMDTAGIREAHEMAEAEGVRRSLRAIEDADIVLAVFDRSKPFTEEDAEVMGKLPPERSIAVLNKSDLAHAWQEIPAIGIPAVGVSAKTGAGLGELKDAVFRMAMGGSIPSSEGIMITNIRHKKAVDDAVERLGAGLRALGREPLEIAALEFREALEKLSEITGAVTTEDILERIFQKFCIGK